MMNEEPRPFDRPLPESRYRRYRPESYMPRMSIFWWVRRKPYVLFIVRELTSIFVAAYAVLMILQVRALAAGPEGWEAMLAWLFTPASITLHLILFLVLLYHSFTWFWIAPTAVVVRIGGRRISDRAIIAANLGAWLGVSAALIWLVTAL